MKEQHPIDDLFQDRLQDFSLEAPMHLWEKMADGPLKKSAPSKKRWLLWWLLPAFLLSVGAFAYYSLQFSTAKSSTELDSFPIKLEAYQNSQQGIAENTAQADILTDTKESEFNPAPISPPSNLDEQPLSTNAEVNTLSQANDPFVQKNNQVETANSTESAPIATVENKRAEQQASITSSSNIEAIETAQNNTLIEEKVSDEVNTLGNLNTAKAEDEAIAQSATVAEEGSSLLEENPSNFKFDLINLPLLSKDMDLLNNPLGDEALAYPEFKEKRPWVTTLDFMASMDFVMRQVEAKEDEFSAYAQLRNNTETFRHGVSLGMRLSTVSERGLAVRSGLNYSVINEQLNFKIKEEEKLTITTKYDVDGSIIGTDTSLAFVGTYRIVNNRYTELDIPLLVGYEFMGERFAFSVNGGVLINMLSAQKGEFVSPNTGEPVSFSSSDENSYRAFRNRLGLGFYGSMGMYFQFKDNTQILLEPYFKYRPGSITVSAYTVDQRYLTAGLFLGLRRRIQ